MADSQNLQTQDMCDVDENVKPVLKKLKFNRSEKTAAVFLKINVKENIIVIDEEFEDCTTDELAEELPERQPRYVVYSYKHKTRDGRTTFPLCFIYYHPSGCNPNQVMRYAGCRDLVLSLSGSTKCLELTDSENLTDDFLVKGLSLK